MVRSVKLTTKHTVLTCIDTHYEQSCEVMCSQQIDDSDCMAFVRHTRAKKNPIHRQDDDEKLLKKSAIS